jgi:hypothetical protein
VDIKETHEDPCTYAMNHFDNIVSWTKSDWMRDYCGLAVATDNTEIAGEWMVTRRSCRRWQGGTRGSGGQGEEGT